MNRSYRVLAFLFVTVLGTYGCMKAPTSPTTENGRAAAKVQQLEDDYLSAITTREQFRQKLLAAEEQAAKHKKALEDAQAVAAAERDALKAEVKARTGERDALQGQYDGFRKTLREMIGSADTAVGKLNLPAPATEPTVSLGVFRN